MNYKKSSVEKIFPLYYSVPLLVVSIVALGILVFVFGIEIPSVSLQPSIPISITLAPTINFNNPVNVSNCGSLDANDTYYFINQSLIFNTPNCLQVRGNNIFLESNYSAIQGIGINSAIAIAAIITGENVTLRGINISNVRIGIRVQDTNNFQIANSWVKNTSWIGVEFVRTNNSIVLENLFENRNSNIYLDNSYSNKIFRNWVFGAPTFGTGIATWMSSSNQIFENLIYSSGYSIHLLNSPGNDIQKNIITSTNMIIDGIHVNKSGGNYFDSNVITAPGYKGVLIYDSPSSVLNNFTISHIQTGIRVQDTYNVNVTNSLIKNTSYSGVYLYRTVDSQVSGNKIVNFTNAIYLDESHSNRVVQNQISGNSVSSTGIASSRSNGNSLFENIIDYSRYSIHLSNSTFSRLTNNLISFPSLNGIFINQSKNSSFEDNFIKNSGQSGILIQDTQQARL